MIMGEGGVRNGTRDDREDRGELEATGHGPSGLR